MILNVFLSRKFFVIIKIMMPRQMMKVCLKPTTGKITEQGLECLWFLIEAMSTE